MLTLTIPKKTFLQPFQFSANAVDKKQQQPILSHVLLKLMPNTFIFTGTDLDLELSATLPFTHPYESVVLTLPAKKMLDILRMLDDTASFTLSLEGSTLHIQADSGRFKFMTLSADHFPQFLLQSSTQSFTVSRQACIDLFESTIFAVAQQDARHFLNGLLWHSELQQITAVGADGHRMVIARLPEKTNMTTPLHAIFPRRAVLECLRLLHTLTETSIQLSIHPQCFQLKTETYSLTSKLIDAPFLPYRQALPQNFKSFVIASVQDLKRALLRTLIVFNDKGSSVILDMTAGSMVLSAHNTEQDEVMTTIPITLDGSPIRIGLNPLYLLDVLNVMPTDHVKLSFQSPEQSILVESSAHKTYQYIIMPMNI